MWRGIVYQILIWDCSRDAEGRIAGRSGSIQVENKHMSNVHAYQDSRACRTCELCWKRCSAFAGVGETSLSIGFSMFGTGVC